MVKNPINKEAFALGDYGKKYPGHTEMFADLTGAKTHCMMLVCGNLRVCHVSLHISMLKAITEYIKKERILEVIKLTNDACKRLGISEPKIGVAALNPHAGENGLFGDEEKQEIAPAIKQAQDLQINAQGPIPSDTLFSLARAGQYHAIVAMYHDQGHIPLKTLGFNYDAKHDNWEVSGVNVTLGLPIIRTSVDHGTAFDKAGKGISSYRSLLDALSFAIRLVANG
ncbi:MAG: 4-hydroxythreonine-4-phosphate dehydrogenase PdxA [Pseudomonadota bacterium]